MKSVFDRYESVFNKYALQRPIKRMVNERLSQGKPAWNETSDLTDTLSAYGATRGDVERYAGGRALSKEVAQAQNFDANKHHVNSFFSALPTGQTPLEQKFVNPSKAIGFQLPNSADTVSAPGALTAKALSKAVPLQDYARQAPELPGADLAQRLKAFKASRGNSVVDAGAGLLGRAGTWAVNNPVKSVGLLGGLALGSNALFGGEEPTPQQQVQPAYSYSPYDFAYKGASWQGYAKSVGLGAAAGGTGGYLMAAPENKTRGVLGGAAVGGALGGGAKLLANGRARQETANALGGLKKNFDTEQTGYYDMLANKVNLREGAREALNYPVMQRADQDVRQLHQMAAMGEGSYRASQDEINQKLQQRLGRVF